MERDSSPTAVDTAVDTVVDTVIDTAPVAATTEGTPAEALVADELLVEEISIDGMCGVY